MHGARPSEYGIEIDMESKRSSNRIAYIYFSCVESLFVFFCKTEYELAKWGNIIWDEAYVGKTLLVSLVAGILLGSVSCRLILGIRQREKVLNRDKREKGTSGWLCKLSERRLFWGSLVLIVLSWLPTYLAYYPAICAYDFPVQLEQITKGEYIDHHPIAHTLLIRVFLRLGEGVFGKVNSGIALFAALQIFLLASVLAYGIVLLRRFRVGKGWIIGMQLVSMFYPFHWYLSISMTKDVWFTVFFLLQILALFRMLLEDRQDLRIRGGEWVLAGATVGMILFRNNGKYAMLVLLVIQLLMIWRGKRARKLWERIFLVSLSAFLMGNLLLSGLFAATHATQGDRREMLCVPTQQLARCMLYHGGKGILSEDDGTMDAEDVDMIDQFILSEGYRYYQADFADPVKRYVNTSAALRQAERFVKTYVHLFMQYPGDFINAVLALDAGYLYPEDETHAFVNQVDYAPGKGYVQTRWAESELEPIGFYKDSKWEWLHEHLEQWAEENAYLKVPVLKYLFVPGVFLWAYLLLAGVLLIDHKTRMLMPLSLVLGYDITLLLGPVVQLRYLYPIMVVLPFAALLACRWQGEMRTEEKNVEDMDQKIKEGK